jgi:hypothetical protein
MINVNVNFDMANVLNLTYKVIIQKTIFELNWTLWPESASELYWPSNRRLSTKLVPTFADRGRHMVSVMDPYGHYFFFQVALQLYSRDWVDPVPDPLLLRKSDSARNRTPDLWICSQKLWALDHRGGLRKQYLHTLCIVKKSQLYE